jgi:hypothetical protein
MSKPTKTEAVTINMKIDREMSLKHKPAIKTILPNFKTQLEGKDHLNLKYEFFINYFGDVERKLRAVHSLCKDPGVIIDASCDEIEEGKILVYKVLKRLEEVIQTVRGRDAES